MKRIVSICAIAALTCVSWTGAAIGGEPRGMETYSFPVAFSFYLPCLGDTMSIDGTIYVRTHAFETNSGVIHLVQQFTATYFVSDTSGREWYYVGKDPFLRNARVDGGEVFKVVDVGRFVPVTEDTPQIMYQSKINMTVNANGELVVDTHDFDFETSFRCLWKKN